MANAVLYNQGSHPAGALKSGTMSMNVSPSLNIGALKWRNGFENNNTWVIYSDTYSQGQATQGNALPTIWASTTFTDAGLLNLINVLPARAGQTPFTDVTAATSWLRGQGVYFLSNQNYPQIVTSGLTLLIDAGFAASFPNGTGTTTYDVSGGDKNGTLTNGTNWVNSGTTSYFSFDGTDDYVLGNTNLGISGDAEFTIAYWAYWDDNSFSSNYPSGFGGNDTGSSGRNLSTTWKDGRIALDYWNYRFRANNALNVKTWYYVVFTKSPGLNNATNTRLYANAIELAGATESSDVTPDIIDSPFVIGRLDNNRWFKGRIPTIQVYNRVLSQSEILQNYYKGPIVTSGLTLALDAGNLVSYGGTGTSWKDLTSNAFNGTLTNGPTYSSDSDGCIVFDGADDYVTIPINSAFNTPSVTYEVWANLQTINDRHILYVNWVGNALEVNSNRSVVMYNYSSQGQQGSTTNANVFNWDTWTHFVGIYDDTSQTLKTYVNGVLLATRANTPSTNYSVGVHKISGTDYGGEVKGKVSIVRHYNRALSANEVQQNFNAQRGRFGI